MKFEINKKFVNGRSRAYNKYTDVIVDSRTYHGLRRIGVQTLFELVTKTRAELIASRVFIEDVAEIARKEGYADWANTILREDRLQPFSTGCAVHIDHLRNRQKAVIIKKR